MEKANRTHWSALTPWVVASPLFLLMAVVVAPRIPGLYGTAAEKLLLIAMLVSTLLPAAGIYRQMRGSQTTRLLLAGLATVPFIAAAVLAVIHVGCSLAGACF